MSGAGDYVTLKGDGHSLNAKAISANTRVNIASNRAAKEAPTKGSKKRDYPEGKGKAEVYIWATDTEWDLFKKLNKDKKGLKATPPKKKKATSKKSPQEKKKSTKKKSKKVEVEDEESTEELEEESEEIEDDESSEEEEPSPRKSKTPLKASKDSSNKGVKPPVVGGETSSSEGSSREEKKKPSKKGSSSENLPSKGSRKKKESSSENLPSKESRKKKKSTKKGDLPSEEEDPLYGLMSPPASPLHHRRLREKEQKLETTCQNNQVGEIIFAPDEQTDPTKLPTNALEGLCPFQITGLKGWGVVTDVIDGDTIDLVVYVGLRELSLGHKYVRYKKEKVRSFVHTHHSVAGFFAKFRCRLTGIDAMEKDTVEGKFAKKATQALYDSVDGKVYYRFDVDEKNVEKKEKYGRVLVSLFRDETRTENFNKMLFQFNKDGIRVVDEYEGKTKSEYTKNLKKRSKDETTKMDRRLNGILKEYRKSLMEKK